MYEYRGKVVNVVDGDTLDVNIDLGFTSYRVERIRLKNIDTPEIYRPKDLNELVRGRRAKQFVEERVLGKVVVIKTYKDKKGKYGRYLADILYFGENNEALFLYEELKKEGLEKRT